MPRVGVDVARHGAVGVECVSRDGVPAEREVRKSVIHCEPSLAGHREGGSEGEHRSISHGSVARHKPGMVADVEQLMHAACHTCHTFFLYFRRVNANGKRLRLVARSPYHRSATLRHRLETRP